MVGGKRRPTKFSSGRASAASGDLPARMRCGRHARAGNALGHSYSYSSSDDLSRPIRLSISTTVAFLDPSPSLDPTVEVLAYNYDPAISGGLRFAKKKMQTINKRRRRRSTARAFSQSEALGFTLKIARPRAMMSAVTAAIPPDCFCPGRKERDNHQTNLLMMLMAMMIMRL